MTVDEAMRVLRGADVKRGVCHTEISYKKAGCIENSKRKEFLWAKAEGKLTVTVIGEDEYFDESYRLALAIETLSQSEEGEEN